MVIRLVCLLVCVTRFCGPLLLAPAGIQDITVSHCDYLRTVPGELQALQDAEVCDIYCCDLLDC